MSENKMIVLYKGARGKGKTLSMVKDGFLYWKEGYKVLRNFNATFGEYIENEDILDLNKESNLNNCILMIDEIQIFFDSRRSMQTQNLTFSNFVQQIRKRNITILCTTQFSNTIDMRLRQHLDIIAFPNYIERFRVCVVTYLDLTKTEDVKMFLDPLAESKPAQTKIVFNAEDVFNLYNTSEMII